MQLTVISQRPVSSCQMSGQNAWQIVENKRHLCSCFFPCEVIIYVLYFTFGNLTSAPGTLLPQ